MSFTPEEGLEKANETYVTWFHDNDLKAKPTKECVIGTSRQKIFCAHSKSSLKEIDAKELNGVPSDLYGLSDQSRRCIRHEPG